MTVIIAHKTILALDAAIAIDQGNKYRSFLKKLILEAEEPFKQEKDPFRSHLGVSGIGNPCARALFYSWRWVQRSYFEGRMMRLFNRGHLEEPRIVANLLCLPGIQIWTQDDQGNQFRISMNGGHFGSAVDAVVRGIPDAPNYNLLGEFKTSGDKPFKKLAGSNWAEYVKDPSKNRFEGEGVKSAKFVHYVQMQIYMRKLNLTGAIYIAVNKNDDMIYAELVEYDEAVATQYEERGGKIVFAEKAPVKLHKTPAAFDCKFCDFKDICHFNDPVEVNCRTCEHSRPLQDGSWKCFQHGKILTKQDQMDGCAAHNYLPDFRNPI